MGEEGDCVVRKKRLCGMGVEVFTGGLGSMETKHNVQVFIQAKHNRRNMIFPYIPSEAQ